MTKRIVLIGHPVAHSLSGAMQQAAFDAKGIDAAYELWDRPPIELPDAVEELRSDEFLGANITIPHKERVVPLMDRLTEEAHATGAVNTITHEGRRLVGHSGLDGGAREPFVVALGAHQARAGRLVEREAELRLRRGGDHHLVQIFDGLDEVGLAEDKVEIVGFFDRDEFEFHVITSLGMLARRMAA